MESIKLIKEIPISSVHDISRAMQLTNKFVNERTHEKIKSHSHPRPQPMSSKKFHMATFTNTAYIYEYPLTDKWIKVITSTLNCGL